MKQKKIAVLGGGTGMSILLKGLKKLPFDISAVVTVSDDGKSTGKLREQFDILAVGDIRRVLSSLAADEEAVDKLFNYRFSNKKSELDGHTIGNLLLLCSMNITGNMSDGIELLNKLLKLQGKVMPLTEDNVVLIGIMEDGKTVAGEHNITTDKRIINDVSYKKRPIVNPDVIKAIKEADAIILSMGSLFTSILPNLICQEVQEAINQSKAQIIYVCNIMTQPGETDNFAVSHHIKLLNKYLGKRNVDAVIVNTGKINDQIIKKYETKEQKDLVIVDYDNLKKIDVKLIKDNYVLIENEIIRHNAMRVAINILSYLMD